jgi:hypothetical protein
MGAHLTPCNVSCSTLVASTSPCTAQRRHSTGIANNQAMQPACFCKARQRSTHVNANTTGCKRTPPTNHCSQQYPHSTHILPASTVQQNEGTGYHTQPCYARIAFLQRKAHGAPTQRIWNTQRSPAVVTCSNTQDTDSHRATHSVARSTRSVPASTCTAQHTLSVAVK